ncbi:MAG: hypothetical protein ACKVH8_22725 [Pirellulales bacterium]
MSTFKNLKQLVDTFRRDIELAKELESGNLGDDLTVKASVIGFSYNSPTQA